MALLTRLILNIKFGNFLAIRCQKRVNFGQKRKDEVPILAKLCMYTLHLTITMQLNMSVAIRTLKLWRTRAVFAMGVDAAAGGFWAEQGRAVARLVERFDRRGTEPFELFRSEFGQNRIVC